MLIFEILPQTGSDNGVPSGHLEIKKNFALASCFQIFRKMEFNDLNIKLFSSILSCHSVVKNKTEQK